MAVTPVPQGEFINRPRTRREEGGSDHAAA